MALVKVEDGSRDEIPVQGVGAIWSQDGHAVLIKTVDDQDLEQFWLYSIDESDLQNLTPVSSPHRWLRWSPDGKYIAYLDRRNRVWLAQVAVGNP